MHQQDAGKFGVLSTLKKIDGRETPHKTSKPLHESFWMVSPTASIINKSGILSVHSHIRPDTTSRI